MADSLGEEITDPGSLALLNNDPADYGEEITDTKALASLNDEPAAEEGWWEEPVMASRAVLDGLWYGWSEEIGASIAAGAAKLMGEDRDYGDVYDEMIGGLQQERDEYSEQHPAASFALGLAGGLASPINIVGGRYVMGTGGGKTVKSIQEAISKSGKPVSKLHSRLSRALQVGVAEGVVAGAGAGRQGEKAESAALGGAIGTVFPMAGAGFRLAGNTVTKRRIAQELGEGEDFIPLNIADGQVSGTGGNVGNFYRDVAAKAYGGAGLIAQQTKRWTRPIASAVTRTTEGLEKLQRNASASLQHMEKVTDARMIESSRIAEGETILTKAGITAERKADVIGLKAENIAITPAKMAKLDADTNALEAGFRVVAHEQSIPRGATREFRDQIATMSPQQAMQAIDDEWSRIGFEVTKGQKFSINPAKVLRDIDNLFENDVLAASVATAKGQPNQMRDFVESYMDKFAVNGQMGGEALTQMRSQLGILVGGLSDAGGDSAALKGVLSQIQRQIDDVIEGQLPPWRVSVFQAERKAWQTNTILRDATTAASVKGGQRGEFNMDQWLSANKANSPRGARQGTGALQGEADSVADTVARRDAVLTDLADQAMKANTRQQQELARETTLKLARESVKLKRELGEIQRVGAAGKAKQTRILAKEKEIKQVQDELARLKEADSAFAKVMPNESATIFEKLFATFLIGGGNVIRGVGGARAINAEATQRVLAGQTPIQQAVNRSIQASNKGTNNVSRAIARQLEQEAQ